MVQLKNTSILVVGGTGFIGYHLAKRCLEKDWKVTSISLNLAKKSRYLPKVKYILCDIAKKKQLMAYKHHGFWQCMDTMRDKNILKKMWIEKKAPWILSNKN